MQNPVGSPIELPVASSPSFIRRRIPTSPPPSPPKTARAVSLLPCGREWRGCPLTGTGGGGSGGWGAVSRPRGRRRGGGGRQPRRRLGQGRGVWRRGPAGAPDQRRARLRHAAGVFGHVAGRR